MSSLRDVPPVLNHHLNVEIFAELLAHLARLQRQLARRHKDED